MDHSRRTFALTTLAALAGISLSPRARVALGARPQDGAAPAEPKRFFGWSEVAPGVRVGVGQGGNSTLVVSGGQAVLIDTKVAGLGPTLRREAGEFGALGLVINTHHHYDHVGGNASFIKDTRVIAHANTRARVLATVEGMLARAKRLAVDAELSKSPPPPEVLAEIKAFAEGIAGLKAEDFAPEAAITGPRSTQRVGDAELVLLHGGPGHTDNDLAVFIPSANTLVTGDLLFHKSHPFIDRPAGASTRSWQVRCTELAELCDDKTVVIPGHGAVTNKQGLLGQVEYFKTLRGIVVHAKDVEGMAREDVVGLMPGKLLDLELPQLMAGALASMYDELEAEKAEREKAGAGAGEAR